MAVDGASKFEGYDLVAEVEEICLSLTAIVDPAPVVVGGGRWWGRRWGGGDRRADDDDARPAGDALGEVRPGPELPGMVSWATEDFGDDANRREWHERKMESKCARAKRQLDLLGLSDGVVIHC